MEQRAARAVLLALTTAVAVGASTLTVPAQAAGRGHDATRTALRAVVERGGLPGVAATVHDGKGSWFGTAGSADTATGRKWAAGDHFRAASNTKMFVATVLLQLEAEGRLSLTDTVEKWLPGVVRGNGNDGRRITLRQLLNHTSGLFDYANDAEFGRKSSGKGFPEHRYDSYRPQDLVAVAMQHPPVSGPGKAPSYANTNYVLAGMVIGEVTGHPYAEEVTRRIIRPLKLHRTSFPGTDPRLPAPHPVAYSRLHDTAPDAPVHEATEQNMTWLGAAGEMTSTGDDLNRFQRALVTGALLPAAQMKEMFDGAVPADEGYAFGLGIDSVELSCGVTVWGHTGRTNGSVSAVAGTRDGRHQLTFDINGDWLVDGELYGKVIEAEFCG
ncbi:serine hydrolase domain-containing protein [Streptomyces sp. NPDC053427]|uniref:serine hydrolase domain-containing protein n=1 Tax=Streptomyces sp. NPDC053427 TaxID=3365701 RepID=UPI0037CF93EE